MFYFRYFITLRYKISDEVYCLSVRSVGVFVSNNRAVYIARISRKSVRRCSETYVCRCR